MVLSGGWLHQRVGRALVSTARPTWITIALLLVTGGLSAQPLSVRAADVGPLRSPSAAAPALPRPALDVMDAGLSGAEACKNARVIAARPATALRLYLDPARSGRAHRFSRERPQGESSIEQDIAPDGGAEAQSKAPGGADSDMADDVWNAIEFMSEPLPQGAVFSGAFSGRLDVVSNRKDFNFSVMLYELTRAGVYIPLSSYWARASALGDPSRPHPLTPGVRQQLAFRSERLKARRVERGSRLVLVLGIIKDADPQSQGGPGKAGGGKTTAAPLTIHWFDDSYIDLQVSGGAEDAPGGKHPDADGPTLPLPRSPARMAGVKIAEA